MLLKDKVAVVYGASGAIGGAVARAFAQEGAKLFLTGRGQASLEAVAKDIQWAGGAAEVVELDALDEKALDHHLTSVIAKAGRLDISFNAIGISIDKVAGEPLAEMDAEKFFTPVADYTRSYFLTARLAARRMISKGAGVIMTVTAPTSRKGVPGNGGYGASQAAKEALTRDLSVELAPSGVRVVSLRSNAILETETFREVFDIKSKALGVNWEQFAQYIASTSHMQRGSTLEELANLAAFMASDKASGMTGTSVNMTMGALDD